MESEKPEGGESCLSRLSCHILAKSPGDPTSSQIIQDTRAMSSLFCLNPYCFLLTLSTFTPQMWRDNQGPLHVGSDLMDYLANQS